MPVNNFASNLISETSPLAAYGEYSEENSVAKSRQVIVPVNHLAGSISPHLLQHVNNPVGWYPWCQEAFEVAKREDKPVFLSIGYSSSHWCHVMERDCFRDQEVAQLMNDACVPVKIDASERPDLDALFMEVCKLQNGSAGHPLSIFLTPEGLPFFSTTWLPKRTAGQMPGITDIIPRVKWLWLMQHDDIDRAAKELSTMISERVKNISGSKVGTKIKRFSAREAFENLRKNFDVRWGGFGIAPKFPDYVKLLFLLKYADENKDSWFHSTGQERYDAFTMIDITLRRMWRGGIHDHLGGGFSRYSTDERWLVPHFEKFLSDQAMMLFTAALAQELKQNAFYKLLAEDIVFAVTRDFCDSDSHSQGFRSAIDADTIEGEGRYYLWTEDEIKAVLPEGDVGLFCAAYAVLPSGNFGNEVAGSQLSYNILYEASTVTELARRHNIKGAEVGVRLSACRKLLLDARDRRPAPMYDDQVLMDWNGLMIGALARASVAFENPDWRAMAERTALFLQKVLYDSKANIWHRRWRLGKSGIDALAQDHAALLWGVMELYKASNSAGAGEKQLNDWLKYAQNLADNLLEKFWDEKSGGLFATYANEQNVFLRYKSAIDVAIPSANSLAVIALNELAQVLNQKLETSENAKKYADYAKKILDCFSRELTENPGEYLSLIVANSLWKPFKQKQEPKPAKILTDEELNREEEFEITNPESQAQVQPERESRRARSSRRANSESRSPSDRSERSDRPERPERRTRSPRRSSRAR